MLYNRATPKYNIRQDPRKIDSGESATGKDTYMELLKQRIRQDAFSSREAFLR